MPIISSNAGTSSGTTTSALTSTQETELEEATTLTSQFDVDEDLNTITTDATLITGTNSVGLGTDHTISAGGTSLALKISDTKYFIPAQELAQGSGITYLDITSDEASKDISSSADYIVTAEATDIYYTNSYTVSADEVITGITLVPAETGYLSYTLYKGSNNTGTVLYEKTVEVTDADVTAGSVTLDASFYIASASYVYAEVSGVTCYGDATDGNIALAVNYLEATTENVTSDDFSYTASEPLSISSDNEISLSYDSEDFNIDETTGDLALVDDLTVNSLTTDESVSVGTTLEVTGDATVSGNVAASGTITGSSALNITTAGAQFGPSATTSVGVEIGSLTNSSTPYIDFHSSGDNTDYDSRLLASGDSSSGSSYLTVETDTLATSGALTVSSDATVGGTLSVSGSVSTTSSATVGGDLTVNNIDILPIASATTPLSVDTSGTLDLGYNSSYFEVTDDALDLIVSNIDATQLLNASSLSNGAIQGTFDQDAVVTDFDDHSVGDWWQCQFTDESTSMTLGTYTILAGDKLYITTDTTDITLTADTFSSYVAYIENQESTASSTVYGLTELSTDTPAVATESGTAGTANAIVANADHSHPFTTQPVVHGGTGLTTIPAGSIMYSYSDDTISALTNSSTANTVLYNDAGTMSWSDSPSVSALTADSLTLGDIDLTAISAVSSDFDLSDTGILSISTSFSGLTEPTTEYSVLIGSSDGSYAWTATPTISSITTDGDITIPQNDNIFFADSDTNYSGITDNGNLLLASSGTVGFGYYTSSSSTYGDPYINMSLSASSGYLTINDTTANTTYPLYVNGNTYVDGTLTSSGALTCYYMTVGASSTDSSGVEIGSTSTATTPFIDFHTSGDTTDYDVRLLTGGGDTSTAGQGYLTIYATSGVTTDGALTVNNDLTVSGSTLLNGTIAFPYATDSTEFGSQATSDMGIDIGSVSTSIQTYLDFHTSGNEQDYDSRILATDGGDTIGEGNLTFYAATSSFTGDMAVTGDLTLSNISIVPIGSVSDDLDVTDGVLSISDDYSPMTDPTEDDSVMQGSSDGTYSWTTAPSVVSLATTGAVTASGNVFAGNHVNAGSTTDHGYTLYSNDTLYVVGAITGASTLDVTGDLTTSASASIGSALTIGADYTSSVGVEVGCQSTETTPHIDFHSDGSDTDYNSRIIASDGTQGTSGDGTLQVLAGTFIVGASTSLSGTLTTAGATTLSSTLDVSGDTTLGGTLTTSGSSLLETYTTIGTTTAQSTYMLDVEGSAYLNGTVNVTGSTTLAGSATINGDATIAGAFTATNTSVDFPGASVINIGSSYSSSTGLEIGCTSSTTTPYLDFHSSGNSNDYDARFMVSGGSEDSGDATIDITCGSLNLDSSGLVTVGVSTSSGGMTVYGDTAINGGETVTSTLGVTGATTLSSTLDVSGGTTLSGDLTVEGTTEFTGSTKAYGSFDVDASGCTLGLNSTDAVGLELGSTTTSSTPYFDIHSSGNDNDYDFRFLFSGGGASNGNGSVTLEGDTVEVDCDTTIGGTLQVNQPLSGAASRLYLYDLNGTRYLVYVSTSGVLTVAGA